MSATQLFLTNCWELGNNSGETTLERYQRYSKLHVIHRETDREAEENGTHCCRRNSSLPHTEGLWYCCSHCVADLADRDLVKETLLLTRRLRSDPGWDSLAQLEAAGRTQDTFLSGPTHSPYLMSEPQETLKTFFSVSPFLIFWRWWYRFWLIVWFVLSVLPIYSFVFWYLQNAVSSLSVLPWSSSAFSLILSPKMNS